MPRPAPTVAAPWPAVFVGLYLAATVCGCRPASVTQPPAAVPTLPTLVDPGPPAPLAIGDAAPPIDVAHWIHPGDRPVEPFTAFEPGRIYVVEFWAPWNVFCRRAMPLMARLAAEFGPQGVVFVGITHEEPGDVRAFLEAASADERPHHCLTADPDGSVHRDYMEAIAETGIPTVFLVGRDGRIEWIGHPEALAEPLRAVVAGSFDREAFAAEFRAERRLAGQVEEIGFLLSAGRVEQAVADCRRLVVEAQGRPLELNDVAWKLFTLATDCDAPEAVLVAAEQAAKDALAMAPDDSNTLDTLAHIQARRGGLAEAIATQRRAVEHAGTAERPFREFLAELEARRDAPGSGAAVAPPATP